MVFRKAKQFLLKLTAAFLTIFIVVGICPINAQAAEISASAACVVEVSTNKVIYSKNANNKMEMASTTKIMTAILVIENCKLSDMVTVSKKASRTEGSSIYLKEGEKISVEVLLYGLMLNSGNDAACALSEHVAGSEENFAKLMNKKAKQLNLLCTSFANASGLPNENHYTTAADLATIAAYALRNEQFKKIVSTKKYTAKSTDGSLTRVFSNHNKMLFMYDGADGVKTGFTKSAGRCLVTSATKNGVSVVCVTLRAPNDWSDHKILLDLAFTKVRKEKLCEAKENRFNLKVGNGIKSTVEIANEKSCEAIVFAEAKIEKRVVVNRFVTAPIKKGDVLGRVEYYIGETKIGESLLVSQQEIAQREDEMGFFERILSYIKRILR